MFVYAFFVGILLAGQVSGANDRYPSPFSAPPASDAGPRFGSDASSGRDNSAQQRAAAPSSQSSDAYAVPGGNSARDSQQPPANVRQAPMSPGSVSGSGSIQPPYGYGAGAPSNSAARASTDSGQANGTKPSAMMRTILTPPAGSRLAGQALKLADVLRGASSRAEQLQRVDAYWDLCSSISDYYLSLREQNELQKLRASVSKVGPAWQQAESELGVRIGTSQRAAVASQYRLSSMMGRGGDSLPLPGDLPHCGDYYARYGQVFAGRQSAEAQQLSELLPLRYEELKDAATAIARAQDWLDAIAAQRSDASDGTGTLRALELLALRRRAFIQIARDYNRRIARYTDLASPGEIGPDRLLSMLIKPEGGDNTATRFSSPAPPLNRQSQKASAAAPKTFAEGWEPLKSDGETTATRDNSVSPASAEAPSSPHIEHSLLVSPQ